MYLETGWDDDCEEWDLGVNHLTIASTPFLCDFRDLFLSANNIETFRSLLADVNLIHGHVSNPKELKGKMGVKKVLEKFWKRGMTMGFIIDSVYGGNDEMMMMAVARVKGETEEQNPNYRQAICIWRDKQKPFLVTKIEWEPVGGGITVIWDEKHILPKAGDMLEDLMPQWRLHSSELPGYQIWSMALHSLICVFYMPPTPK